MVSFTKNVTIVVSLMCVWLFAFSTEVYSQVVKNTPIWGDLEQVKTDSERLAYFKKYISEERETLKSLPIEEQIKFYQQGISSAKAEDSLVIASQWTISLYGIYSEGIQDYERALDLMLASQELANNVPSSRLSGNLYLKLAASYYNLAQFDEAINYYTVAENRFGKQDSIFVADAVFFRAQAKDYKGMFLAALDDYERARTYYEHLNDPEFVDYVLNGISILFSKYGLREEAEKIRLELLERTDKNKNFRDWAILMYNRSNDFRKAENFPKQYELLKEIEAGFSEDNFDPIFQAMIYFQLANYYASIQAYEKQEEHFRKGQSLIVDNNVQSAFADMGMSKAELVGFIARGEKSKSLQLAEEFLQMINQTDNYDYRLDGLQLYAQALKLNDRPAQALQALESYHAFKDSVFAVNQANSFAYYQTIYETERKERELLNKTLEIENITQRNAKRIQLIVVVSSLIIIALLLMYLINRLSNLKRNQQLQAQFAQDLLVSQEEERQRISKDLHDGLGQSLLLIKNKISLQADEAATSLLGSAIEELRGISRSLHPFQLEELGLSKAIQYLLDQIDENQDIFIDSTIEDVNDKFNREGSLHVYRIVQEVFNNILKHSNAKGVRFYLGQQDKLVVLSIEDNGIGFDFSEKFNDFKSLGLKTLKERTAALSGSLKVDSEKGKGTKFIFQFPIK